MLLIIDQEPQSFTPIKEFRQEYNLPADFGLSRFMPGDNREKGCVQHAGVGLRKLREAVLRAVPCVQPDHGWTASTLNLQSVFQRELYAINDKIGLNPSEIDFAVMGFGEVCQTYVRELLNARMAQSSPASFSKVYLQWLTGTVVVSRSTYSYEREDEVWRIRLVRTAYGCIGLIIYTSDDVLYVHDPEFACPVESFMVHLLSDVAVRYASAIRQSAPVTQFRQTYMSAN